MKKQLLTAFICLFILAGCDNSRKLENGAQPEESENPIALPDSAASQPADSMAAREAEIQKLQGYLRNNLLKEDLKDMTSEQRKFQYATTDLNDDGSMEYLIGFQSSYFCGSGGCTYLLIDNSGKVLGDFSVSGGPFIIADTKTNGYHDLLVSHNGKMHKLQYSGTMYPGNPSTAPFFPGKPATGLTHLFPENATPEVHTF